MKIPKAKFITTHKENIINNEEFEKLMPPNQQDIDWDRLADAVIQCESGGNPNAYNPHSQAIGLMQITPIVLKEYNQYAPSGFLEVCDIDLYNAYDNKSLGTWYLHRLHEHYNCDTIEKILMAYNWGIGNCRKHNFDIKKAPKKIKNYVFKVIKLYNKYWPPQRHPIYLYLQTHQG